MPFFIVLGLWWHELADAVPYDTHFLHPVSVHLLQLGNLDALYELTVNLRRQFMDIGVLAY